MDAPDSPFDTRYSWMRLALTLGVAIVGNVGLWVITVVMPEVQQEFDATRAQASLPYALTMVGFALGNLFIGRAVDRWGMAVSLAVAALVVAVGYSVAALAPSILLLSLIQFVIGFGSASCFGPLIADISQWFRLRRGIAVAIAASGNYLSGAIWPILLSALAADAGWRWVYGTLAILTVVVLLPSAALLRKQVPADAQEQSDAVSTARARKTGFTPRQLQLLLGLAGVCCCVAMSMPQVHIVALCVDMGFGSAVGAEMLSLMLLGGVVSRVLSGYLADWLGGVRTVLIGSTLQAVALFLYLPAGELVSLYVVSLVFGLSQGGIVPSYALIVREYLPAKEAGARVGFVLMMTILGMALGGWLSGAIYDWTGSYQWAFINGIVWNGLNIAIMIVVLVRSAGPKGTPVAA
ncbi:MFS transporter [Thalassococcus lentus]|uniref:MFS transporter n=1 Tax=Thalassococcus lentus TaxID=1210524 RepID=A0ABT4XMU9_9RHOB|nr:MFS transporter [Thalassococcus lentus]MDA7423259.1 MFS transporter [Thalassococcus lentus]